MIVTSPAADHDHMHDLGSEKLVCEYRGYNCGYRWIAVLGAVRYGIVDRRQCASIFLVDSAILNIINRCTLFTDSVIENVIFVW